MVAEARSYLPDVIMLDIGLPGLDGYQVASRLREDAAFATTTLVALSGYGREQDRQRSKEAGFNYHFVKPVELDELTKLFNHLLNVDGVRLRQEKGAAASLKFRGRTHCAA